MDGLNAMPAFEFTATPAGALIDIAAQRFPARPALDFLGRRYTYAQIQELSSRAAAGLQKYGVAKGVHVGLCLPNCPYFVIMFFAILKAGGTVVHFNPLYTADELGELARDTNVSLMVSMDLAMIQSKIGRLAAAGRFSRVIICRMAEALPPLKATAFRLFKSAELAKIPNQPLYTEYRQLLNCGEPFSVAIDPDRDIAVLQFTGGTTGIPKAAMLTHTNIMVNVEQSRAAMPAIVPGKERILAVLPFFHVFAMTAVMNLGLSSGAEILLLPRPDIKQIMATLKNRRPTLVPGVPTLFTAICNAEATAKLDLGFIKFCISGGAPLSAEVLERFERIAHCPILEGYGLSEASPVVAFNRPGKAKHGSVGPAVPGTSIEIRDPANPHLILPPGRTGEICVRGPQIMPGYYKRPDETALVFIAGALRTGDLGHLDEDGYLFITDRIKDLIICGGYNVYPRVIEEAAYQHPAVQDAVAIGVPDAYRGQAPKLFVTLRPNATAEPAEILKFLARILNKIEMPREVEIRATLPKTMVGKLSKKELIEETKKN